MFEATVNLLLKRGVRSALEYARSGDIARARAATNPDVAPHLAFVDMGGHGYAVVTAGPEAIETEFGIKVKNETSARDSFKSISTLANYVESKLGQEQPQT